jgi:hypothetical protein
MVDNDVSWEKATYAEVADEAAQSELRARADIRVFQNRIMVMSCVVVACRLDLVGTRCEVLRAGWNGWSR